ncbi:MAG: alpha/beta hydrolase [Actinomycetota bacterium]|nr:alpha/beta hydrolase [Actinomycetota bacterium]
MQPILIATDRGDARVHLHPAEAGRGALVLGHGAGGGVNAPDLTATAAVGLRAGLDVALVEQPYRVAGRRAPAPAPHLDAAWLTVIARLAERELAGRPLVFGGRSLGARVACRTAAEGNAVAVLCLAFPLLPPRRAAARTGAVSREPELDAVPVPMLVVQGDGDRFGMPAPRSGRAVVPVTGDHSLRSDLDAVSRAVGDWLAALPALSV